MAAVEEKTMVPTILIGLGGTGAEILSRIRRLVEESYGSLSDFPILSFLWIDTDRGYKISNPEAAGKPFRDNEQYWARVSGKQAEEMVNSMDNYPWINRWFPNELERNITSLEAGAGQIRACGRFAFFCNYYEIRQAFEEARNRIKGRENFMLDQYGVKVLTNSVNVFVTGSLSGGTGSGMLVDVGYCARQWLQGEGSATTTAIVPMPNAFSNIQVGERVLANGYAALMELSYFSDDRTEYCAQYSNGIADEIRSNKPPFDFTYLVGTKNGERDFSLSEIREMIAQNIFLDLTSDFAPHKRSIRDNIKGSWAEKDPGGRGYPKNFMSFGLSTIEVPMAQIRTALANRLSQDLINWWLNESVVLPPQMEVLIQSDILKPLRLTEEEMMADLMAAEDRSYLAIISEWVNSIRNEISRENLLECTQQGVKMLGHEKGKVLEFVEAYLQPKVEAYRANHFREMSSDERLHGDFLQKMYRNRDEIINQGCKGLETEFYAMISDRDRGLKFADTFLSITRQIFDNAIEKLRREQDKVWSPKEINRQRQYESGLEEINQLKNKSNINKQAKIQEASESTLNGLEGWLMGTIQRKARALGLEIMGRMKDSLDELENRLNRLTQKLNQARDYFDHRATEQTDSADALQINGLKLYNRQEINTLYTDLIEQLASVSDGQKSRYDLGIDSACTRLSETILHQLSPLGKDTRGADEVMQLLDLTNISDLRDDEMREIVFEQTYQVIEQAPNSSRLRQELSACNRILQEFKDDDRLINNIRIAYNKSKPLIRLSKQVMQGQDAGFTPSQNTNVAVLGGRNTTDPSTQKIIPKIKEFVSSDDAIKPLGETERHRIVFVQEVGGFSLRCIEEMKQLRQSYQDWRGEAIVAQRARLRGENKDLPIPVHIDKVPPFWDIFPEDPNIFKLVIKARALGILKEEQNPVTKELTIRYEMQTAVGSEKVDLAANWEQATQILEVRACQNDREAIEEKVIHQLSEAETQQQKQALYEQFLAYLQQRETDLIKVGGKESPQYKREAAVLLEVIETYKLQVTVPDAPEISAATKKRETTSVSVQSDGSRINNGSSTLRGSGSINPQSNQEKFQQLKELKEMYDQGFLTEEEFQKAKKDLLGM